MTELYYELHVNKYQHEIYIHLDISIMDIGLLTISTSV